MNKPQKHRSIIKERLTILLVCFFCILISGSEYIIEGAHADVEKEQLGSQSDEPASHETFVNTAVDAVVPFVFVTVDHVFHLIYEIVGFEEVAYTTGIVMVKAPSYFSEILLERIISPNAP